MRIDNALVPPCPDPSKDGLIWKNVSDEIELKDGKANPSGWSFYRMEWKSETVGVINSGSPEITGKDWQMTSVVDPSDDLKHVFFFKGLSQEDWDAIPVAEAHSRVMSQHADTFRKLEDQ
jgi:hypothetical protein